jgi:hypothetical protein
MMLSTVQAAALTDTSSAATELIETVVLTA